MTPQGLVVAEESDGLGLAHHLAVDGQDVAGIDPDGGRRQGPAVDGHPALGDQALDLAPRGDPGPGQGLSDSLASALRGLTFIAARGS